MPTLPSSDQRPDWAPFTADCHAVVNLAGALQDSRRDRLDDIHAAAIAALAAALPPSCRIVHISAPGVSETASTAFYRSKARGDDEIRRRGGDYVILRPAVVLSPEAYGGSALLRALATFPWVIPAVHPESAVQTVALDDVVSAVRSAIAGAFPLGSDMVLAEPQAHSLGQVLQAYRQWLGLRPAPVLSVPAWLGAVVARGADLGGYAGWPVAAALDGALQVAAEGVTGPSGRACTSLEDTLDA